MSRSFLLEIGCEEIPARALPPVLRELKTKFCALLEAHGLDFSQVETMGSARRLVVHGSAVSERQADQVLQTLGPPERIAFENGKASKALVGFGKKLGVAIEDVRVFDTDRGRYMGIEQRVKGKKTVDILAFELPDVIRSLYFPKSMYWTVMGDRFARPVRWVLALWGDAVVPVELFGVHSGSLSQGHRILGSGPIRVSGFEDYLAQLEANGVLVSQQRRRVKIETELTAAASLVDGRLVPDPDLLEEVVYINEYPTVVPGAFDERFLQLPREVLVTVMRVHQKYFAVESTDGNLLSHFLAVANTRADPLGLIRKGHERVIEARLSDALFFWEIDGKRTLESRSSLLGSIVFQKDLGTYSEKVERMERLARKVSAVTDAQVDLEVLDRVVRWAKADLTTDLVGEFPDMQGIVGGLYARREGAPREVWTAIYDQYRPVSLEDRSPATIEGCILALADRLDTVIGCFSVGMIPTGSEDPFGVRRQTQGIIKVLLDHRLGFSLRALVDADGRLDDQGWARFKLFFEDRLRYVLGRLDFEYDEVNAVLAISSDDPTDALNRAAALRETRGSPDLAAIAGAFKRIKNILKQAESAEGSNLDLSGGDLEAEEADLARLVTQMEPRVSEWTENSEYAKVLEAMASFRSPIDAFFDRIMVMHEDMAIRRRRVHLLDRLFRMFSGVADISEVVVSH